MTRESITYMVVVKVSVALDLPKDSTDDDAVAEAISRTTTAAGIIVDAQVVGKIPTVTP